MLIRKPILLSLPRSLRHRWRGEDSRLKIAAKAKMWFGGDVTEARCIVQGGIVWHIAALCADIEGMCCCEEDGGVRQEMVL